MFAQGTDVPVDRSKAEIERILTRYGATRFMSGWDQQSATLAFEAHGKRVRFVMHLPTLDDVAKSPKGQRRNPSQQRSALDGEVRRRWRALALVIKAKLEAVASGVTNFEVEFMAHILLPNGDTAGSWLLPQIDRAYSSGKMPPLLPAKD